MTRIVRLQSENVQRLKAVDITPPRNVVTVGGKNGNGKTSLLDSIAMALGGADEICDVPVRRGAEKAKIVLELEDLIIKRTFTANGGTALVVENKDGARYPKPQDMIDKLTSKLTFDPLEFMLLKPAQRLESLKRLTGLDLSALDAQRKKLYDERTLVNREASQAKARAEFMPHHPDAPADEQSVVAIVEERDRAKEHNVKETELRRAVSDASGVLETANTRRSQLVGEIEEGERRLKALREKLFEYQSSIPNLNKRLEEAQAALLGFTAVDLAPINERLAKAEILNAHVRHNKARAEAFKAADEVASKATALTTQIDEIDRQKAEAVAAQKFPVAGLSFDDTGVLFNGLPFDQASDAEKLRVSVAMGLALNPKLKVLLVRNASLLDDDSMALLRQLAEESDSQVWLEVVSTDAGKCSVIIEDGTVKVQEPFNQPVEGV